jgi:chromosome segregation ATPase
MEDLRRNEHQLEKEIFGLKSDLNILKTTLIGIDGQNGLRGTLQNLNEELSNVKNKIDFFRESIGNLKSDQKGFSLILATKEELKELESKIFQKLEEAEKSRLEEKKELEKRKKEDEINLKRLRTARYSLYIAIVGLIIKEIIPLVAASL